LSKIIRQITGALCGLIALISLIIITSLIFIPIFLMGILKLFPQNQWRIICSKTIDQLVAIWTGATCEYVKRFCPLRWEISGPTEFNTRQWYLVIANHQSWLDVVILQQFFHQKIPVLKFFIKDALKWIPLFNFAWWIMGCPFMKRYSKEYLEKNPQKKGRDVQATQKALALFKSYPSSFISFVEGTRFSREKHQKQQSPYQHLLKPKAGGISHVIHAMGEQLHMLIDATIVYPRQQFTLWDLLCRRLHSVRINIRVLSIPDQFIQSSGFDEPGENQHLFRTWLNEQWAEKDRLIGKLST
jgi:1-acyl-sn-glycerol-3-phosphate acyltransferase